MHYNEPFLINPPDRLGKYRLSVPGDSESYRSNPLGEELLIIGGNPKNRRRSSMLSNAWYGHTAEHARAARKGWRKRTRRAGAAAGTRRKRRAVRAAAPRRRRRRATQLALPFAAPRRRVTRRRRRRAYAMSPRRRATRTRARRRRISSALPYGMGSMYRANPVRRRRSRRARRNPVAVRGIIGRFTNALPLAVTGGASIIATNIVPGIAARYVGTSDLAKYGVQAATAVVGGMGISKFVGREHGTIWTVASLAVIAADLLSKHVVSRLMPGLGVGAYETGYEMGAFPFEAMAGVGAFPEEAVSGFGGFAEGPYGAGSGPY